MRTVGAEAPLAVPLVRQVHVEVPFAHAFGAGSCHLQVRGEVVAGDVAFFDEFVGFGERFGIRGECGPDVLAFVGALTMAEREVDVVEVGPQRAVTARRPLPRWRAR